MSLKHLRCIFSTWMSFGQDCLMWRIESWPYTSEAGLPHNSSHGSRLVTFVEEHQKCNEICLKWFQKNKTFTTYPDNCNALCSLLSHHWFKPWPWENKIMPFASGLILTFGENYSSAFVNSLNYPSKFSIVWKFTKNFTSSLSITFSSPNKQYLLILAWSPFLPVFYYILSLLDF